MEGYIYLLEEMGDHLRYKIGFTKNDPKLRLKPIKTGNSNPVKLLKSFKSKHYIKIERIIHRKLSMERKNLEWFELNDDQVFKFEEYCREAHELVEFLLKENEFYE